MNQKNFTFLFVFLFLLIYHVFISTKKHFILQFFVAVSNYTGASKDDKLKFAFMVFDDEGNGVITRAELLKMLKANHMAMNDSEVSRKADTIMVTSRHSSLRHIFYPEPRLFPHLTIFIFFTPTSHFLFFFIFTSQFFVFFYLHISLIYFI